MLDTVIKNLESEREAGRGHILALQEAIDHAKSNISDYLARLNKAKEYDEMVGAALEKLRRP